MAKRKRKRKQTPKELAELNRAIRRIEREQQYREKRATEGISPGALQKVIQRAYAGNETAIQRLYDYVNYNAPEVNKRLQTLEKNEMDIFSPTTYLKSYLHTYGLSEMPQRIYSKDDDISEVVGQAQATRRFLSSPLSRVVHAKEYVRKKVDYVLDPNGRIDLQGRLGRQLAPQERSYLGKLLADTSLADLLEEKYGATDEILENVIDEFDFTETVNENVKRVTDKIEKILTSNALIQTRYDYGWNRLNTKSIKAKGKSDGRKKL